MLLTEKNGLCKMIHEKIGKDITMYLDGDRLSAYWDGADCEQVRHLRLLVSDYIGCHMLHDSYKTLMIIT